MISHLYASYVILSSSLVQKLGLNLVVTWHGIGFNGVLFHKRFLQILQLVDGCHCFFFKWTNIVFAKPTTESFDSTHDNTLIKEITVSTFINDL